MEWYFFHNCKIRVLSISMKEKSQNSLLTQLKNFGIGPIVGMFVSMLTVPITTRFVSPEEFGKSSLFTLVQTLFNLIVLFGTDQSFVRFYNTEQNDKKELLYHCILFPSIFCLLVIFIMEIMKKQISFFMFDSYEPFIMWLFIPFLPALLLNRFGMLAIRMDLRGKTYSFLNVFQQIINFVILLFFLSFYERTFRSIVLATIFGVLINTILIIILSQIFIPIKVYKVNKQLLKDIFSFGLPLVPATVLSWVMNSFDKIALRTWSSFEELGLYSAAFKIVALLHVFQNVFTTTWIPIAYRWYEDKVSAHKFDQIGTIMIAIMSILFSFIIVFRNFIMLLLGESYRGTENIFVFLLFSPVLYTVSEVTSIGIGFSKKTVYSLYISIIATTFNLFGNFLLVPKYGAQGAAISTCICYLAFFWGRTLFSRKLWLKFSLSKYIINLIILIIYGIDMILFQNIYFEICLLLLVLTYNGMNLYKIIREREKKNQNDSI